MALYTKHGYVGTSEYTAWAGIKDRCLKPNSCNWYRYGGKQLTILEISKEAKVSRNTLRRYLAKGMSVNEAVLSIQQRHNKTD